MSKSKPSLFTSIAAVCLAVSILPIAALAPTAAVAQDKPGVLRTDIPQALAERVEKEGRAREACKKAICEASRSKKPEGDPIACKVVKTWPAVDLKSKILRGKMEWTFGNAQCEADLKLDRAFVAKVAMEPKLDIKVGRHKVVCNLEQEDGKETHKLNFTIDPTVTFENGKAVKAVLGWTEVDGTTLAKSALWSATAVDNTFNMFQSTVVEQINDFFGAKCDEALKP